MNTFKDTDLREALRRKYADSPQLPADFLQRMHNVSEKKSPRPLHRRLYPVATVAVAASLLLLIGFYLGKRQTAPVPVVAEKITTPVDSLQPVHEVIGLTEITEEAVAQTTSVKPQTPQRPSIQTMERPSFQTTGQPEDQTTSNTTSESLEYYIARLEAEMENLDDSVNAAQLEKIIAADAHLQQLVNRIVGKQVEQAVNELQNDSTANYINF